MGRNDGGLHRHARLVSMNDVWLDEELTVSVKSAPYIKPTPPLKTHNLPSDLKNPAFHARTPARAKEQRAAKALRLNLTLRFLMNRCSGLGLSSSSG